MKTVAIDIKHSVFENETEAIMYITRDFNSDSFIVAIPVITFSWEIQDDRDQADYEDLLRFNWSGDSDKRKRLVEAIKEAIAKF